VGMKVGLERPKERPSLRLCRLLVHIIAQLYMVDSDLELRWGQRYLDPHVGPRRGS